MGLREDGASGIGYNSTQQQLYAQDMPALVFDHKQPNRSGEGEPGSMQKQSDFRRSRGEKGQTIILVAVSLVSLLAIAALAIDVVTLYVARSEIQRAADAAALAGAKAIADSGITTLSSNDLVSNQPNIQQLAATMAGDAIAAVLPLNLVAGSAPSIVGSPVFNPSLSTIPTTPAYSWQVTVTLQQNNLPTFFARIFGRTGASTTASATAEAYSPANIAAGTQFTPVVPRCVKPWLVANRDPLHGGNRFIDPTTFAVESGVLASGGSPPFDLTPDCPTPVGSCPLNDNPPKNISGTPRVEYVAASVTSNSNNVTPSCAGTTAYEQSIESCDTNPYAYLNCGGGTSYTQWDSTVDPSGPTGYSAAGALCLIHASAAGSGNGQDSLDNTAWPVGPNKITAGSPLLSPYLVSTSSSIVTVPIIDVDSTWGTNGNKVTILGFLQAFINCVEDGSHRNCDSSGSSTGGDINITVLNVVGCNDTPSTTTPPVIGGSGTSPIPVRLISP